MCDRLCLCVCGFVHKMTGNLFVCQVHGFYDIIVGG